jgi:protein-S-isoprenylcysteine O-methyltransferase Ste14
MTNHMTEWGVGPKFTLYSVTYCVIMFVLTIYIDPFFKITKTLSVSYQVLVLTGIILIVLGVPFYLFSMIPVMRAFKERRLITSGVYGMCRHPVYAAWLLFFVPSLALFINSWAFLSAPFVMYVIARTLVSKEDVYLEETFGQAYLTYKKRVPAILPYGWLKRST